MTKWNTYTLGLGISASIFIAFLIPAIDRWEAGASCTTTTAWALTGPSILWFVVTICFAWNVWRIYKGFDMVTTVTTDRGYKAHGYGGCTRMVIPLEQAKLRIHLTTKAEVKISHPFYPQLQTTEKLTLRQAFKGLKAGTKDYGRTFRQRPVLSKLRIGWNIMVGQVHELADGEPPLLVRREVRGSPNISTDLEPICAIPDQSKKTWWIRLCPPFEIADGTPVWFDFDIQGLRDWHGELEVCANVGGRRCYVRQRVAIKAQSGCENDPRAHV